MGCLIFYRPKIIAQIWIKYKKNQLFKEDIANTVNDEGDAYFYKFPDFFDCTHAYILLYSGREYQLVQSYYSRGHRCCTHGNNFTHRIFRLLFWAESLFFGLIRLIYR